MSDNEDKEINEQIAKILNDAGIDPEKVSKAIDPENTIKKFEVEPATPQAPVVVTEAEVLPLAAKDESKDLATDYKYTRDNLYQIIEKGMAALDELVHIGSQNNHPRVFEVAGQMVKTLGDVHDQLIGLHKKMKDLAKEDGDPKGPKSVTNNLFVGSTSDLDSLIKAREEKLK